MQIVDDNWRFEGEGDVLRGRLEEVEFKDWVYDDGREDQIPLLTVTADGKTATLWAFHAVLRRKLERLAPQIGEEVEITVGRERQLKRRPGTYYEYTARCPNRPVTNRVDWGRRAAVTIEGRQAPELGPGDGGSEVPADVDGLARPPAPSVPDDVREAVAAHKTGQESSSDDIPF
jgi:hypothetical protein